MGGECSSHVLALRHDAPEEFGECLCQTGCTTFSAVYLFMRDMFAYFHFGILLWEVMLIVVEPNDKVYLFFDFWNQALLFITSELAIYSVIRRWSDYDVDENCCWDEMPWYSRVFWALYSMAVPSTIVSCFVYWGYRHTNILSGNAKAVGVIMATLTPLIVILDFLMVAFPLRLLHIFFFIFWYCVYVFVTLVFHWAHITGVGDMIPIYSVLDWREPKKAIMYALIGLAIGLGVYFILWGISALKNLCKRPCPYE